MESAKYKKGLKRRQSVLGKKYVENALVNTTDFDQDFQRFITENAWGDVWLKKSLQFKEKSLITICLLAAMRHWEEFDLHIKTAINNGVKKNEIAEALFHVAIYAGVPAANTAFRRAKKLI